MQLSELKMGDQARITAFLKKSAAYRQQLLAMGLLPGVIVTISHIAPLGDPIEIRVRGTAISLRKKEAQLLQLQPL